MVYVCSSCSDYIGAPERFGTSLGDSGAHCDGCGRPGAVKAYEVDGHLGSMDCTDCLSMTHCESHHKIEGLYPREWLQRPP